MPKTVKITTEVFCTLQIEGQHQWSDCPITEVKYLRYAHRHLFHIKAYKKVNHDDRDIEFIMFKHDIQEYITKTFYNEDKRMCVFGPMSCEMIAKELISKFNLSKCEVSEDGENGAIVVVEETLVKSRIDNSTAMLASMPVS